MRPFPQSGLKYFLAQWLTLYWLLAGVAMCQSGCANVASVPSTPVGPQAISVAVTPSSGSVMLGNQFPFTAAVKNSSDSTVTWSVKGVAGGAAQTETISASGVYTAPGDLPIPANLTVTATSHADDQRRDGVVMPQFHNRSGIAVVARMCCAASGYQFYGADAAGTVRATERVAPFVI
jgi:hypothetical protein